MLMIMLKPGPDFRGKKMFNIPSIHVHVYMYMMTFTEKLEAIYDLDCVMSSYSRDM